MSAATTTKTVTVSDRAVMGRINRKLAKEDDRRRLHKTRAAYQHELGDYYITGGGHISLIIEDHITRDSLERRARRLGALQPWEELKE